MKKYNVNVNGTAYEVTVEEVVGGAAPAPVAAAPAAAPAPTPVAAPAGAGEQVKSPMPGNILSVNVNVGDTVAEDGKRDYGTEGRQGHQRERPEGRNR